MAEEITPEQAAAALAQMLATIKSVITATPFSPLASGASVPEIQALTARASAALDKLQN